MKKIRIILYVWIGALLMPLGCADLEENPDFSTADNFYTTPEQLEIGLNGVYDGIGFANEWFNHFYNRYVFECIVGYQVGWEKGPLDFQNGNVSSADIYIDAYWNLSYSYINAANTVIKAADNLLEEGTANDAMVSRIKGEALFLRAFYYYNLVRYFDNIPMTTEPSTVTSELPSNDDGENVALLQIQGDLNEAIGLLPTAHEASNAGRATSVAAQALLVKAYLQHENWDMAASVSQSIIDNAGLSLFTDFSWNFDIIHENQGERIFEAQVSAAVSATETNNHHAHFVPADLPNDQGGVGWHWLYGTKDFRMQYDDADTRISGTFLESYPTLLLGQKTDGTWPWVTWDESAEYSLTSGFVDTGVDPDGDPADLVFGRPHTSKWVEIRDTQGAWDVMEKNIVYLRYADVLLGNAEANNERSTGDAYFGINEVRTRAGLPILSGLTQTELRDAIVNERVQEFAFEQEVYPELKRKSTFGGNPDYLGDYIQRFIDTYGVDREVKARDYVLPIPLNELLSNPNVEQNDVWQ